MSARLQMATSSLPRTSGFLASADARIRGDRWEDPGSREAMDPEGVRDRAFEHLWSTTVHQSSKRPQDACGSVAEP
jgi:hypothetical protein